MTVYTKLNTPSFCEYFHKASSLFRQNPSCKHRTYMAPPQLALSFIAERFKTYLPSLGHFLVASTPAVAANTVTGRRNLNTLSIAFWKHHSGKNQPLSTTFPFALAHLIESAQLLVNDALEKTSPINPWSLDTQLLNGAAHNG